MEVTGQLQRVASRRKQVADVLSGNIPDQSKSAEQMQEELRAAANLKVIIPSLEFLCRENKGWKGYRILALQF